MGHQIERQTSVGNCQLTQCSCGRSALKIKDKFFLLSTKEVGELSGIFGSLEKKEGPNPLALAVKLAWLTDGKEWTDFSAQS